MKTTLKILAIMFAGSALMSGCTVVTAERGEYFGYNNNPTIKEQVQSNTKARGAWHNPLADNKAQNSQVTDSNSDYDQEVTAVAGNQIYTATYVPVIVPWWYRHYNYWTVYPEPSFYMGWNFGYGSYFGCDWYAPWYSYNPYYGYGWDPFYRHNHYWGYWNNYDHYYWNHDRDRYRDRSSYTSRSFGPGRGGQFSSNSNGTSLRSNVRSGSNYNGTVRSGSRDVSTTDSRSTARGGLRSGGSNTRDYVPVISRSTTTDLGNIRSSSRNVSPSSDTRVKEVRSNGYTPVDVNKSERGSVRSNYNYKPERSGSVDSRPVKTNNTRVSKPSSDYFKPSNSGSSRSGSRSSSQSYTAPKSSPSSGGSVKSSGSSSSGSKSGSSSSGSSSSGSQRSSGRTR